MKVIKRDGRAVEYERNKIEVAIEKANNEVRGKEKATKDEIKNIVNYIEELGKKRILVEDVQDIIEEQLMQIGKYDLAKKYIVYRYTRALIRKQNTTDESILSLIKNSNKDLMEENSNKNAIIASTQRDLIAGEVSKDLTKRMLLPEKISKAHEEGILHFHDADYFLQPIFNCCLINISDMLDNGTVMNGKMIETPKSFQVACTVMTQIIASVASSQYGGQSVDIKHLGKYLRKSREKFRKQIQKLNEDGSLTEKMIEELVEQRLQTELSSGVQTIQYQINTLMTTNGQSPFVTLFLNLEKDDEYIEE
ncbi:MAG: anaerobic ribonucleoside-triphosphate reductase, partial [Clostridia bacterium]|nr:anaerobic ribonucleoside-triphosphate reductase [Clostridia bacterium]